MGTVTQIRKSAPPSPRVLATMQNILDMLAEVVPTVDDPVRKLELKTRITKIQSGLDAMKRVPA